jgi:hypothetical protein
VDCVLEEAQDQAFVNVVRPAAVRVDRAGVKPLIGVAAVAASARPKRTRMIGVCRSMGWFWHWAVFHMLNAETVSPARRARLGLSISFWWILAWLRLRLYGRKPCGWLSDAWIDTFAVSAGYYLRSRALSR